MADQRNDCATYCVIPLSIQPEGDDFLVGNQDLQEYYQFPQEGVRIIRLLQQGVTVAEIKRTFGEAVDIDDFLHVLLEARFIHAPGTPAPAAATEADRRWKFAVPARLAGLFFSWPAWGAYGALIAYALFEAVADPRLRINPTALYLQDHFTVSLLTLLVLHSCTTGLHELGHMMAAAKYGVQSRLGWGNRLWNIVAEADLSGLHALPRQSRYLPLVAGMLVDVLNIALITLLIKVFINEGSHPFIINIFQALILQILITLSWQFNVFLKTDVYYVLCTYCNYPNLDSEARVYLREKLHQLSLGRAGAPGHTDYYHLPTLRAFAAVWVAGRVASLAFLFLVVIPTVLRYGRDAWNALGSAASASSQWDLSLFFILSATLLAAGLIVWIRGRTHTQKT
ncbi:hypothetical protein GJ700_27150 [Duganella sp. FT92W]|uniref:Peptidase M50 n=1 Tax=Pseudoduganella rivuli TaxID=2666085 RepID=A0A7X2ISR2_9BURK|nr:hypothetical protein [Pseudoduganella rivuli]MRV75401.1 hypothetical protein [Pseudoduganella rivuli]